jgi:hypothetical protein
MIFFLNRGLILEQEIAKALKNYFKIIGVPAYYKNYTVSVTNDHPFAQMLLSETPEKEAASLFPVVVVATEDDSKPGELTNVVDTQYLTIEPADITDKDGVPGTSDAAKRYMMMTGEKMDAIRAAMEERTDKRLFGATCFIRRRDHVSIEIWAENPQLKNELYELIRLFVCGFMRDYLAELYRQSFGGLDGGESPLAIFDSSVRGQRSNNFNVDFGVELYGAHITFDADYIIEQSVIDTDLRDIHDNLLLEVINHAKGYADTTAGWIFGPGEGGGGTAGTFTNGNAGTGESGEAPGNQGS